MNKEQFGKALHEVIESSMDGDMRTIEIYSALVAATKQVEFVMQSETLSILFGVKDVPEA